jgi:hypothetical protein
LLLFTGLAGYNIKLNDKHEQQYDIFFHLLRILIFTF